MKNGILRIFINMGKKNVDVSIEIFRVIKKNLIPPYPFPAKNEKELFATRNSRLAPQNIFFWTQSMQNSMRLVFPSMFGFELIAKTTSSKILARTSSR